MRLTAERRGMRGWFPFFDLGCAAGAGALWYLLPHLGPIPLLLGLSPWIIRFFRWGRVGRRTPYDLPLTLFLATAGIGIWASYDQEASWSKFWLLVGACLIFYAFANGIIDFPDFAYLAPWLLAVFGAVVAIYFLATHDWEALPAKIEAVTRLGRAIQSPLPTLSAHRLSPNVAGGILATLLPFAGLVVWQSGRSRQWTLFSVAFGLLLITLFALAMTTSRGGWMGAATAVILFVWWVLTGKIVKSSPRRRWLFIGVLLGATAVLTAVVLIAPERVLFVVGSLSGGQHRLDLFRNSLVLAMDYPFIGAGPGFFMPLYSAYAFLIHVGYIVHAHNIFLDVAIEQGAVALLTLFWLWGIMAAHVWREAKDGKIRPAAGAALLSLVVILTHGLVEDALYGSRAALLLFVPLAFILPVQTKTAVSRWFVSVFFLAAAGLIVLQFRPLQSLAYSNLAAVQQSRAELSVYSWPEWAIQDEVRRQIDLKRPIANFERALSINPQNAGANRRLGQIELSLGEYERALTHLELAYESTPWDNTVRQLLGEAYIVNGRVADGAALWQTVNNEQGQLAARLFWYEHIGDTEREHFVDLALDGYLP